MKNDVTKGFGYTVGAVIAVTSAYVVGHSIRWIARTALEQSQKFTKSDKKKAA